MLDREALLAIRDNALAQAERLTQVVEPLLELRATYTRQANAINDLLRTMPDQQDVERAIARATEVVRPGADHVYVRPAYAEAIPAQPRGVSPIVVEPREPRMGVILGEYESGSLAESAGDSASVMEDIFERAGRALHRDEIYQLSKMHELGPLNRSTVVTRLSRDERFERRVQGYWVLRAWPPERKRLAPFRAGVQYSEALSRLERMSAEVSDIMRELEATNVRLARMRSDLLSDEEPSQREVLEKMVLTATRSRSRLVLSLRQQLRHLASTYERATSFRAALGDEEGNYPPLPPPPPPIDSSISIQGVHLEAHARTQVVDLEQQKGGDA